MADRSLLVIALATSISLAASLQSDSSDARKLNACTGLDYYACTANSDCHFPVPGVWICKAKEEAVVYSACADDENQRCEEWGVTDRGEGQAGVSSLWCEINCYTPGTNVLAMACRDDTSDLHQTCGCVRCGDVLPSPSPSRSQSSSPSVSPSQSPSPSPSPAVPSEVKFFCEDNENPLHVMKESADTPYYSVSELNVLTGQWDTLFVLDQVPAHQKINAVGMYHDPEDATSSVAFGAIGKQLCSFNEDQYSCFETPLASMSDDATANAGTIIGTNYYYGENFPEYWVSGINTETPIFHTEQFHPRSTNKKLALMDFTGVIEKGTAADTIVNDADGKGGTYLFSLSKRNVLYVFELEEDGSYGRYAGIPIKRKNILWGESDTKPSRNAKSGYGSAYTFSSKDKTRVFFSSNKGFGLMELLLPIKLPASCWTDGTANKLNACGSRQGAKATLSWFGPSDQTEFNDGFNCRGEI